MMGETWRPLETRATRGAIVVQPGPAWVLVDGEWTYCHECHRRIDPTLPK